VRTGESRKTRQSATDKSNMISTATITCVVDRFALLIIAFARCTAVRPRRKAVSGKAQKG